MFMQDQIEKPKVRGKLRQKLGKEYFCLKEKWRWWSGAEKLAKLRSKVILPNVVIEHKSVLLRPLKDVEMYLQHNKVVNLSLAIKKIDGVIIKPGETFSIWQLVGRPSKRKGFLEGMTLHNGKVMKDTGGGLCQLGNLIYWMVLHTPLTVTKRWRHSYDVFPDVNRTLPFGSGATLSYNYIDLQFKNTTQSAFQLNLWIDDTHLRGAFLSEVPLDVTYQIEERNHHFQQQWWGGYTRHNEIWRKKIGINSSEVSEELLTENHAIMMYNPLLE